jgi:hypothetical protein
VKAKKPSVGVKVSPNALVIRQGCDCNAHFNKEKTMKKQRHLVEIPEDVVTAVTIVRQKNGQVGLVSAKGEPGMMEVMALTFGVFVSFMQGAEEQGINEMVLIRQAFADSSLERILDQLVKIAVLVQQDMKGERND